MLEDTLFVEPDEPGRHKSQPRQYDADCLNNLLAAFEKVHIDPEKIQLNENAVKSIACYAVPIFLRDVSKPGPFKKAAALALSLLEHPPLIYIDEAGHKGDVPDLDITVALEVTRAYITATYPAWRNMDQDTFSPPSYASNHFYKDLCAYLKNKFDKLDVRSLGMILEIMTYNANPNSNVHDDFSWDDVVVPGVALKFGA